MTRKKSILAFVLAVCLIIPAMLVLVACGENEHTHTYSNDWSVSDTHHWHKATCEHTDEKDSYSEHSYDDSNDADCNICGFVRMVKILDIIAEGGFEKGTKLSAEKIEETNDDYLSVIEKIAEEDYDEEKVALFNISLKNINGVKIQPNGKVKITMPKPFECEYGYTIFHIKENGDVENLEANVSEANIVFETESFSYFIVVGNVPPTNPPTPTEEPITALQLSYESAGFVNDVTVYTIGDVNKPRPNDVVVYGVTTKENKLLTLNTDYSIDFGSLNFEQVGVYTITYTYIKNYEIKATLTINVVAESETGPIVAFSNTQANDSLNHLYNGTAVFVSKDDITVDGTKLSEITDEDILNKISYVWRNKNTKTVVTPDVDITLTGEINTSYGVNRNITIGNEIAGPCVVGEYEFVLYYSGIEKLVVEATITESKFEKIVSIDDFDATTAPTILGKICYYTIVGFVNGQMYVMQMPADSSTVTGDNADAEARLVAVQEDGSLVLGEEFDFVFTPMRYYESEWRYYPETSTSREDLLVDFCTGYYGARMGVINIATPVINRIGWTKLSGNKIVREKGDYVGINYGNLTKFADDGAVTIYAPRKSETVNNALRLVKDGDKYVFTGKDVETDTRESFPIYIYKQYVEADASTQYDFYGKLDKQYDGNAVQFNAYKDVYTDAEGEDIGSMLKMESIRFVFKDQKGNIVMIGNVQEDGTVAGPSEVGRYVLVIQLQEKTDDGPKWVDETILTEFQIYSVA